MKQKTKKILLLISTILILLIDLLYIFILHSCNINLEISDDLPQISAASQILILCICSTANLISVFLIYKNLIQNKKKLIILNVIHILLGNIFNIISGTFNIIILCINTTDIQEKKEKKKLPILEDITKHKWYVYFLIFILLFAICYTPIIDMLYIPDTKIAEIITLVLLYAIQITLSIIPMINELKRDFIVFKNNFKLYLSNMLPRFGIILITYLICNLSVFAFVGSIPTNQAIINTWPLYITAILAIIVAPLTEELMFRGFMKKFIKNDILFVIFSSLIFGGLHIVAADSWQQILFILPYSILGFAFSLNYVKTRNIASNIFLHSSWNSLAVIAMLVVELL